jgi:putative transposase
VATVSKGNKSERFGFINQYGSTLGIRYLCKWLRVSPSGFYRWRKNRTSDRSIQDKDLTTQISEIFNDSLGTYGSPRIHAALKLKGVNVGRKRVERLMRAAGLKARAAKVYRQYHIKQAFYTTEIGNTLISQSAPTDVNQQWVGDLTYIRIKKKWHYLAVVMDLYSRRIISWSLGQKKDAVLTLSVIVDACHRRNYQSGLIFHTDRGSEYGAYLIQDELERLKIVSSMNRPDTVTDNALLESFFHTMKSEYFHGRTFEDFEELENEIRFYIDGFYNPKRLHSSLGYLSPDNYERLAA